MTLKFIKNPPIYAHNSVSADLAYPVDFIKFEGMNLLVVEYDNIRYTKAKSIIERCRIDWRSAKRTLRNMDNPSLYGCIWLRQAEIWGYHNVATYRPALHVRVDRSHLLLARISTNRMRAHGNDVAADALLKMQNRWADCVHQYEFQHWQHRKSQTQNDFDDMEDAQSSLLNDAIKIRSQLINPAEVSAFDSLIRAEIKNLCAALGGM